jgi:monooxygenase
MSPAMEQKMDQAMEQAIEHHDVIIVGAGLSGVGAAVHLRKRCPDQRFIILEARDDLGGTWDLFRYPGVRSDSDMYTLGYDFKPWCNDAAIASGQSILDYIREAADENGVSDRIRLKHRVTQAKC